MGDMPVDPNDKPPSGPRYTMFHEPSAGRSLYLLTRLRVLLTEFRFERPVIDTFLNETYRTTLPFIDDIVYFMSNPIPRNTFRYHLLYVRNTTITANNQNLHTQNSYNEIISNIDELLQVLRFDAPQGTNNAGLQGSGGAASALQWTALERLMNLMDKHVDTNK